MPSLESLSRLAPTELVDGIYSLFFYEYKNSPEDAYSVLKAWSLKYPESVLEQSEFILNVIDGDGFPVFNPVKSKYFNEEQLEVTRLGMEKSKEATRILYCLLYWKISPDREQVREKMQFFESTTSFEHLKKDIATALDMP